MKFELFRKVALGALVLCSMASLSKAQDYQARFTLPFEARWANVTLPAGNYTVTLDSISTRVLVIRGEAKTVMILAGSPNTIAISDRSQLTAVKVGGEYVIQKLEAGEIGLTFSRPVPQAATKEVGWISLPLEGGPASAAGR